MSEQSAYALQGGEDPALLPVLVDKRFGEAGRHQLSLFFSTAMVPKFVEGTGAYAAYQYNFNDIFGLEVGGGYFFSSETSILGEVRGAGAAGELALSDLYQLQWIGNLDLMVVPIYGKMSFASEFDPSFDLFLLAGAGMAGTRKQVGTDDVKEYQSKVTPAFNFGVGFRFYFNRLVALRLEFRDFFYPDPGSGAQLMDARGNVVDVSGLTFNLHFQGGLQFSFGGDE